MNAAARAKVQQRYKTFKTDVAQLRKDLVRYLWDRHGNTHAPLAVLTGITVARADRNEWRPAATAMSSLPVRQTTWTAARPISARSFWTTTRAWIRPGSASRTRCGWQTRPVRGFCAFPTDTHSQLTRGFRFGLADRRGHWYRDHHQPEGPARAARKRVADGRLFFSLLRHFSQTDTLLTMDVL